MEEEQQEKSEPVRNIWMAKRMQTLVLEASNAFADGRDPFDSTWLAEHEVTGTECITLGRVISHVIKGFLLAPSVVKNTIMMVEATEGVLDPQRIFDQLLLHDVPQRIQETRI